VLRGPQGTLFGKNVIGGAIQYITKRPQDTFGARVKSSIGSYDRFDVSANVDIPLSDTFLTKITAAKLSRDGFVPSTTIDKRFGSQNDTTGRLDLLWQPSDSFNWRFAAGYDDMRTNGNPYDGPAGSALATVRFVQLALCRGLRRHAHERQSLHSVGAQSGVRWRSQSAGEFSGRRAELPLYL
jgi:outer membrane receptor protein involved in Fe transport